MAKVTREHLFDGNIETVFQNLTRYQLYPEYLPGVTSMEILEGSPEQKECTIRYELNLIKKFYYVLSQKQNKPDSIAWSLVESNLMKLNQGSWTLKQGDEGKTLATYDLEIKVKGLIPRAVTDKLAEKSLPAMFAGFQKMINEHR